MSPMHRVVIPQAMTFSKHVCCASLMLCGLFGCGTGGDGATSTTGNVTKESPLVLALPGVAAVDDDVTASSDSAEDKTSAKNESVQSDARTAAVDDVKQDAAGSSASKQRMGEDWPRFLGPCDTGISGETGLLASWPEQGPPIVWEKRVGTGYSAPSVRGNLLVLHHRVRNAEVIDALEADTGKPVWSFSYPSDFSDPYGYNNGPRCTPLLT